MFLLFLCFWLILPWPVAAKTLSGRVLRVFDGDTLLVRVQGREEHVRLREIDAPEVSRRGQAGQEPWGRLARQYARALAAGKTVRLEIEDRDERDRYQRILAYVFPRGIFLNLEMIRSGRAFFYEGPILGRHAPELRQAEKEAREKGLGVWDPKRGLKERPYEFRNRTKRDENLSFRNGPTIRAEKKPPAGGPPPPADKIVANKRSMIYHLPGSDGAARVSPRNGILFDTAEEAERAGFRPARAK